MTILYINRYFGKYQFFTKFKWISSEKKYYIMYSNWFVLKILFLLCTDKKLKYRLWLLIMQNLYIKKDYIMQLFFQKSLNKVVISFVSRLRFWVIVVHFFRFSFRWIDPYLNDPGITLGDPGRKRDPRAFRSHILSAPVSLDT